MNTKKFAGAVAVGAVSAVTTLILGATPALADESSIDYAYALKASGVIDINPISHVKSKDGKLVHDELLSIGDVAGKHEDDISLGLLTAEAESHRAETAVKEVNILNLLRADLIRTWCDNGKGGLQIVNGKILGRDLPDTSVPGHDLDLSPLVKLSLNDQVRHSNGSLTVTGLELTVLPGAESNPDKKLSAEERAALPVLGNLLGKTLSDASTTVRDVLDELGGPLALDGDLQKITIGKVNCQEGDGSGSKNRGASDNDGKDGDKDKDKDKDGKGKGDKDGDGDGKGKGDSEVKSAPAPSVVKAALPVTG